MSGMLARALPSSSVYLRSDSRNKTGAPARRGRKSSAGESKSPGTFGKAGRICDEVTREIVEALTRGVLPWRAPWNSGGGIALMPLRACGTPYRGVNVVVLWRKAVGKGYLAPFWMTYRQASALGGQVRKGERGTTVIKVGTVVRKGEDPDEEPARFGYLRSYSVFNADQIDGLCERFRRASDRPPVSRAKGDPAFMSWFRRLGVGIETSGAKRAFYDVQRDVIHMPPEDCFEDGATYIGVLLHELVHATGAAHRLDRRLGEAFNGPKYAHEELVAELGSAMAGALLGIEPRFEENAAYLNEWIKVLKSDSRAIIKAASEAQAACDWLMANAGPIAAASTDE